MKLNIPYLRCSVSRKLLMVLVVALVKKLRFSMVHSLGRQSPLISAVGM